MDGFAIRADDTPGTLPLVGRIAAGRPAARPLAGGEAMGIATGGVVPDGADAVVPLELVTDRGDAVEIPAPVAPGANVRPRGGDVTAGTVILPAGSRLTPHRLAAVAAVGHPSVSCHRRPRVAILTTGTELRAPGDALEPGQIFESNGLMLAALLERAGALVDRHHPVVDDDDAHRAALEEALAADVLVTSGGVSVGPHDLVRRITGELRVEEVFWGVAMRPGKPFFFGARDHTLVFGLPGNPVSSLVGALLFVVPAIRALQGDPDPAPQFETGVLAAAVTRSELRDDFVRARWSATDDGAPTLVPVSGQESHMIVNAAGADAIVRVPRGAGQLAAGASARYLRLDGGTGV